MIELVEYQRVDINSHFIRNAKRLKKSGIPISIDDYGKDFTRTDVAIAIEADEIKFDRSLLKGIDRNYVKFKHLVFLLLKIRQLCTDNIVFEGVETQAQNSLIELIVDKPIIQGFLYYRPMPLNEIIKLDQFDNKFIKQEVTTNSRNNNYLDYLLHKAARKKELDLGDKQAVNAFLKQNDVLGVIHNEDPDVTFANLRDVYFNDTSLQKNGVMSMLESSEKLVIIRNNSGVVIYENKAHKNLAGHALFGLNPQSIIASSADYQTCLEQDSRLIMNNDALYHIDEEEFGGDKYHTIREKVFYNNRIFIITNICPIDKSFNNITKDKLTGCHTREFLHQNLNMYNNCLLAFADLNGFKAINDNYGHDTGDHCLIEFSSILRSMLRDKDVVIRYGGDEFVILFDSYSEQRIENRLKDLNESVKTYFNDIGFKLSFSYGLTHIRNNNINDAISAADEKMYKNKRQSKAS